MSPWVSTSDVSKLNAAEGRAVIVDPASFFVLQQALKHSRSSDGRFDISFAAVGELWRFEEGSHAPPPKSIEQRLGLVDFRRVLLDDKTRSVRLADPRMRISLNGIAKGYAVDCARDALRAAGIRHFLLRLGGDLYASGRRGDRKWKVAIQDPRAKDRTIADMEIEDAAFSTSGDYERFFMEGGKRYHHILDPKTGYPASESRSVTLLTRDAITAEGLSKAVFIGGRGAMQTLLNAYPGSEAVLVDAEGNMVTSSGLVFSDGTLSIRSTVVR
jgi:thiamine biosynthesis lipoprotein